VAALWHQAWVSSSAADPCLQESDLTALEMAAPSLVIYFVLYWSVWEGMLQILAWLFGADVATALVLAPTAADSA